MPYYNLAAEFAALLVICISMVSFVLDDSKVSTRYKALKWLYISTFLSIIITIISLLSTDYYQYVPIVVTDIFKYLYFLFASVAAPMALFYAITLTQYKNYKFNFFKQYVWAWLPYALYCVFILTNHFHHLIFTISPTQGYIRGDLFRITYVIALIYFVLIIYYTIVNFKTTSRNALLAICLNLLISSFIFCAQLIFPPVQLSGTASVCGILIIHFYVQNASRTKDALTEVYNRQTLTAKISKMCKSKTPFHLFVCSVRNFKGINDRNGLEFGDAILEQIALRLREIFPEKYLFRYSGDEFAVLIPGNDKPSMQKAQTLYNKLSQQYTFKDNSLILDLVIARIDHPQFGNTTQDLISAMDFSVSSIKNDQGDIHFIHDISVCQKMKRRYLIIDKLKQAINDDGFEAYYQPIYSLSEEKFTFAEALIRFKDGLDIYPSEFIPIAEDTGMIIKITTLMINKVCEDYKKLIEIYGESLPLKSISINVPYVWLIKKGALDVILDIVHENGLKPSKIKLEITERTFAIDLVKTVEVMNQFIEKGFIFELDDFGVEYSNLGMFFNVPVDIIKFDRCLVKDANLSLERKEFFRQLVLTVKKANATIIMEGVEDKELLDFLDECFNGYIQGYYYSKPLPFKEFCEFLINSKEN